ncbi:MAG: 2OG-Fe(II) oxygenase family protein, partial [Gammaproteobacteria bacterium]|nr:2OG-Fe(II) oxygenase family protein [Gammaproteobacteria bacterium]
QTDSLNQGPDDALHSFVLSDFSSRSAFPREFQRFLRDEWPAVTRAAREIERSLLVQLGVEGLLESHAESYGHMMSANYYPPGGGAQPNGGLRLTEHPDVSLLTLFPFGAEAGFEYQDAKGAWCALAPSDRVVGFAGELLEWLTGGRIQALNHRVAPADGDRFGERFSFSLFSLPRPGTRIERHPSAAQGGAGARVEAISVEAYIEAHLSRWL